MAQNNQDLISLEKKLLEKEERLERERENLDKDKEKLEEQRRKYEEKLEKASSLTRDEAKKELLEEVEQDEAKTVAKLIKQREEEAKLTSDKKAQEILVDSMRHGVTNYIAEYTVSVVKIVKTSINLSPSGSALPHWISRDCYQSGHLVISDGCSCRDNRSNSQLSLTRNGTAVPA